MSLVKRIKELALPLGYSLNSIEKDVDLGHGTIRKWDANTPSADKLLKVANLLDTSMEFLLTGSEKQSLPYVSAEDREWLSLVHQLPADAKAEFRGEIKGYLRRMNAEGSVAADQPMKMAK